MDITDFKSFEIAGFDIAGWENPDKSIQLDQTKLKEFPKEITCNDVIYTLETIKKFNTNEKNQVYCNATYV